MPQMTTGTGTEMLTDPHTDTRTVMSTVMAKATHTTGLATTMHTSTTTIKITATDTGMGTPPRIPPLTIVTPAIATARAADTAMGTEPSRDAAALLHLMWLASPALPVGGFSYSEGLEAAVDAGLVTDETQAGDWLCEQLRLSLARADLPVCAQAFEAWREPQPERILALNDWVLATRESAEFRLQTEQMGRSLVTWMQHGERADDPRVAVCAALAPAPSWPVAFALAAMLSGAAVRDAMLAFAFGWAENMVQAAMKSVPLGQVSAQRMLARLAQAIPEAVAAAQALPDGERQAFTPMLAILSSRHETQYSRLFRS